ncbi:sulfate transport system substrate-binding protein [Microlunatus sagamiharensis]|jgi:sulfate transport system substrate-binding protein|uniref:Sulfate transport system substrate-binding protein n=1 Tax=Microlunatus sagamiharensis TaxID=546874 RepID=A0A1H2MSS9_9ACTN|nr:sulfate ABC transporter substrate-binding protein [Microlunatus sagamiharensis]SDU96250.1 sulfate transport system substrate-binding protein [Microlunatus sagamiharensis]
MSPSLLRRTRVRAVAAVATAAASTLLLAGCVGGSAAPAGTSSDGSAAASSVIHLVGYSVPKEANKAVETKFLATPAGQGVSFEEAYGPSGDQSRAVVNGLQADYVSFSLEPDVTRLVKAGLVDASWNSGATKGMVADSVVVIAVRKGNPKGIKGWDDLVKPGIKIITPNPASSGSARWNTLAAYEHTIAEGGSEADAKEYLTKFFGNVQALPGSGRDATNAFLSGDADALISYENEAILARQSGEEFDYVVPDQSVLIENPAAVTTKATPKAKDYLDYVLSADGQAEFVKKGFRPVVEGTPTTGVEGANDPSNPFPTPAKLTTIADLGGWDAVNEKFFADKTGIVSQVQQATGKSQ